MYMVAVPYYDGVVALVNAGADVLKYDSNKESVWSHLSYNSEMRSEIQQIKALLKKQMGHIDQVDIHNHEAYLFQKQQDTIDTHPNCCVCDAHKRTVVLTCGHTCFCFYCIYAHFGNADKYFRSNTWDAFFSDDFRLRPGLTLNLGVRWDYNSPITELYGRLVNLAVTPGFAAATPSVGGSLINPDKRNIFANNYARIHRIDIEQVKRGIAGDEFQQARKVNPSPEPWSSIQRWPAIQQARASGLIICAQSSAEAASDNSPCP